MVKPKKHFFRVGDLVVFKPGTQWVGNVLLNDDTVNTNIHRVKIDTEVLGKINELFIVNNENTDYKNETMYGVIFFSPVKEYLTTRDNTSYQFKDIYSKGHLYHYHELIGECSNNASHFNVITNYENIQPALIC